MALARLGSGRSWEEVAVALNLPATVANSIGGVLQSWIGDGIWPALLTELDALFVRLQVDPPPIDYRVRREIGQDVDLLDRALLDAGRVHSSPLSRSQLRRVFWEAFTAGDTGFAPDPLALDRTSPECAA